MQIGGNGPVVVIGDVMEDIIVKPDGPMVPGSDVRAKIRSMPGGSGANQALWLAEAGVPVRFVARVGVEDAVRYRAYLTARHVTPVIAEDENLGSGRLVTLVDPDGERSFFTDRAANTHLCADDLPVSIMDGAALVHVSAYALFEPGPREAVLGFCKRARSAGIPVSVDPSSTGFLKEAGAERFLTWTRGMAICFPNFEEAAFLSGSSDIQDQVKALSAYYDMVVIKRGADGSVVGGRDGIAASAAAPKIKAVDTTGAGDAFFAGFVAGLRRGLDLEACLTHGNAAGARAATYVGGQPPAAAFDQ